VSPPFNRNDAPDSAVVQLSGRSPRYLARYVRRIRTAERARGILTGPDWGILMPRPTFQSDGFHLMDGAYAAAGSYWFDFLCLSP